MQRNLFPDQPEEFSWLSALTAEFEKHAPQRNWTALLHFVVMMHPQPVDNCSCGERDPLELHDWMHLNHAAYNTALRSIIIDFNARKGLKKALDTELQAPVDESGYGPIVRRDYGLVLRDLLRAVPQLNWFKRPYDPRRMYQGTALENQRILQ